MSQFLKCKLNIFFLYEPSLRLDNPGHDKRRGQTDIYRGEVIKSVNQEIRDILEFFPEAGEIRVGIKLVHWSSLHDHWSVDLILLYFAGRQNQDLVLECHSGPAWITEKERDFSCKMKSSDSERSIQKIAVNTCDTRNAATKSERIFMKFCRNLMNFEKFSTEDCCRTNSFQIKAKNSLATLYASSTMERHHLNQ